MPAVRRSPARRTSSRATVTIVDQYLSDIHGLPLQTREEEIELARRSRQGDLSARDALVTANLRFVVSVAKKFMHHGVPLADLVSEGNMGLLRAAEKFDETRGVKFISYGVWWIRQAILQSLAEQGRVVRIPVNTAGSIFSIGQRASAMSQELGRDPTVTELCADVGLPRADVERALAIVQGPQSLDGTTGPGGDDQESHRLGDILVDEGAESPDVAVQREEQHTLLTRAIHRLSAREQRILTLYYGLGREAAMTLEAIGAEIGVTRERVRQIKERALLRLRTDAILESAAA
jgi:RNA polymerase primary sigma factor